MEATAGASPASTGAGTGSAQSGSPSSQASASNSAGQPSPTQRPSGAGGAPPSSDIDNRDDRESRQESGRNERGQFTSHNQPKQEQADDDPEFDFGEGRKAKRSQVLKDVHRMRQDQAASAKRADEAQKRYDSLIAGLKKFGVDEAEYQQDPEAALQKASHNRLKRQIEEAQMDPRELEMKRRDESLQEREQRLEQEEKQRQQEQYDRDVAASTDRWSSKIYETFEQSSLPKTPQYAARMATLMLAAAKSNDPRVRSVTPEALAQAVHRSVANDVNVHFTQLASDPQALVASISPHISGVSLDGGQIATLLGPKNTEALRKHLLSEAQSKFTPKQTTQRAAAPRVPTNPKHPNGYFTWDEMKELERKGQL